MALGLESLMVKSSKLTETENMKWGTRILIYLMLLSAYAEAEEVGTEFAAQLSEDMTI
jgi:hypothetical protein